MRAQSILANKHVAALIPAAGSGRRMGGRVAKQYLQLRGREILAYTLDIFETCPVIDEVWLIVAAGHQDFCQQAIVERYGFTKVRGIVVGGETRQDSVWRGLQQVPPACDIVVVHDGVRPLVTEAILQETIQSAATCGAAIVAVPVHDTLKRVSETGIVEVTVPREGLWRVQTPQAFHCDLLQSAFQQARERGVIVTDEAGLIEAFGHPVQVVLGAESNVKITTPYDLSFCEHFMRGRM